MKTGLYAAVMAMALGRLFGSGLLMLSAGLLTMALAPGPASASAPTLNASTTAVQPGEPVTFTGTDFGQCTDTTTGVTAVELYANEQPLAAASGDDGGFQVTTAVSATPGLYRVTARCSNVPTHDLASASMSVITLAVSPGSGVPSQTIGVTGSGYTLCSEVQVGLVRDGTVAVATSGPVDAPGGTFDAELTVPAGALPGDDYTVEDGCDAVASSVALPAAVLATEPFTVATPVASPSPTASSPSPSPSPSAASSSPSPTPSPTSRASSSASPPPHFRSGGGPWTPVALIGGTGVGAALLTLGAVRASSLAHRRRGRAWVRKHMRAVAGQAGSVSAGVQERPGAASISVGLEPHSDPLGRQHDEEAGQ